MFINLKPFEGELYVISDASYLNNHGPFKVEARFLRDFIENHMQNFGQLFLDTDVIIVSFKLKLA